MDLSITNTNTVTPSSSSFSHAVLMKESVSEQHIYVSELAIRCVLIMIIYIQHTYIQDGTVQIQQILYNYLYNTTTTTTINTIWTQLIHNAIKTCYNTNEAESCHRLLYEWIHYYILQLVQN